MDGRTDGPELIQRVNREITKALTLANVIGAIVVFVFLIVVLPARHQPPLGKLILLNVNHSERNPDFPDVPTLTELGIPGADVPIWYSLWGPAGLSKDIVQKLNTRIADIAQTDDMKARMRAIGAAMLMQTPEQLAKHLIDDTKSNAELIRAANIKLE